jgi:hypothetical protein
VAKELEKGKGGGGAVRVVITVHMHTQLLKKKTGRSSRKVKLTTQMQIVPTSKKECSFTLMPPVHVHDEIFKIKQMIIASNSVAQYLHLLNSLMTMMMVIMMMMIIVIINNLPYIIPLV